MTGFFGVAAQSFVFHTGYVPGRWYMPAEGCATGSAVTTGTIRLIAFPIFRKVTISDIGVAVVGTAVGGLIDIAIYAHDPGPCRPTGNVLAQARGLSTTTATVVSASLGGNVILQPNWYWAASQVDVTGTLATARTYASNFNPGNWLMGSTTNTEARDALSLAVTQAYAAFPDMTTATIATSFSTSNALPVIKAA